MSENAIYVKRYENDRFPIKEREIWRYAGYKGIPEQQELRALLDEVIGDLHDKLSYRVCYRRMPQLPFGAESKDLAKCLNGCDEIVIFAATVGLEVDRYIAKHQRLATTKALLAQAYGAERIECLCNAFCKEMSEQLALENRFCTARFSPGYGDLPLAIQKDFFRLLDCNRQIGVSLNESLLMTPSKSVTAFFGIRAKEICEENQQISKCRNCSSGDCIYRR